MRGSWINLREPCMEGSKLKQIWAFVAMVIHLLLIRGLASPIKSKRFRRDVAASSVQIRSILQPFVLQVRTAWKVHNSRSTIVSRHKIAQN